MALSEKNTLLQGWRKCNGFPGGAAMFSRFFCWRVPYFGSIRPRFTVIEPGRCEARIAKRRRVLNHLGTIHAIALCNLAELVGGSMMEATVPRSHRWIPKGMTVAYTRKAETDVRAVATWTMPAILDARLDVPVEVLVFDMADEIVLRATITMFVSERQRK